MAIALVVNSTDQYIPGGSSWTTSAIDTTGSNFLVASISWANGGSVAVTDSKANTWTALTLVSDSGRQSQLFYSENPTVGTSHTFTITHSGGGGNSTAVVAGYSGVATSSAFDKQSTGFTGYSSTVQPGSLTPAASGSLMITGLQYNKDNPPTIDSGYTIVDAIPNGFGFTYVFGAMAHQIQTTITARNPTWTQDGSNPMVATHAVFKEGGGGPAPVTGTLGATETKDIAALTGTVLVSGTLGATEAPDTALIQGTATSAADWIYLGTSTTVVELTGAPTTHTLSFTGITARQSGDVLVACLGYRLSNATSVTLPAGWTLVNERKTGNTTAASSSGIASGVMAYCIRGASDPALNFQYPNSVSVALGTIVAYRPATGAAAFDTSSAATSGTASATVTVTGVTTAADKDLLVFMAVGGGIGTGNSWSNFDAVTDPTTASGTGGQTADVIAGTWQERVDSTTATAADVGLAIADAERATAGATGNFSASVVNSGGNVGIVGAFKFINVTGTLGVTEAPDTVLLQGTANIAGTLAATEAPDAAAINGGIYGTGTLAVTEVPDAALISGAVKWDATLATTEAPDAALIQGGIYGTGTLAVTETPDTALINGAVKWNATLAATEAPDAALIQGGIYGTGTLAVTEAPDTTLLIGTVVTAGTIAGSINAIEAPDAALFNGAVTGIAGILVATEAPDTALFTGTTRWNATLAATEVPDTALITGTVVTAGAITGILSAIEASDIALFAGSVPEVPVEPGPEPTPLPPSQPGVLRFGRRVTISRW
jgi:hypothetical protein